MEGDMRKFILITAMVLVSATAHAGQRSLTLASSDEPAKSVETSPVETKPAEIKPAETTPEAPKFVDRPSVVDTNAGQPAAQCQPAPTSAEAPKVTPREVAATERPRRRHQSTESRIISELHRHGIYW
jgi:outer membrane biosynthesis protein TonB